MTLHRSLTNVKAPQLQFLPAIHTGLLVLLLSLSGPQVSHSETTHVQPFTKKNISPVSVMLIDNAINGCWTNPIETKTYAQGQMELAGLVLNEGKNARTSFEVTVSSERAGNGLCYGNIEIALNGIVDWDGTRAVVSLAGNDSPFTGADDVNTVILDKIKQFATGFLATLPEGQ